MTGGDHAWRRVAPPAAPDPAVGLSRDEYEQFCRHLGLTPAGVAPSDYARHLPAGCTRELLLGDGPAKLRAYAAAGRPSIGEDEVWRWFRFCGARSTANLLRNNLLTGAIAEPARWYLLRSVAVFAVGRECVGYAHVAPPPRCERLAFIADAGIGDEDLVSIWLHEAAHCWLLPLPPPISELEDVALSSMSYELAAYEGHLASLEAMQIEDERQACALAAQWGATGLAADKDRCVRGPQRLAQAAADAVAASAAKASRA